MADRPKRIDDICILAGSRFLASMLFIILDLVTQTLLLPEARMSVASHLSDFEFWVSPSQRGTLQAFPKIA